MEDQLSFKSEQIECTYESMDVKDRPRPKAQGLSNCCLCLVEGAYVINSFSFLVFFFFLSSWYNKIILPFLF